MVPALEIFFRSSSTRLSNAPTALITIVSAVGKQLVDVAKVHGQVPALTFDAARKLSDADTVYDVVDEIPEAPNALGYHDEKNGVPYGKIAVGPVLDSGGTILQGSNSVACVVSHEVIDPLFGDWSCNTYKDGGDGNEYAAELCDACETDSYEIDGVSVSNWLTQAFFDAQAPAGTRLDFMGLVTAPFQTRPGGYQLVRSPSGQESQVFGAHGGARMREGFAAAERHKHVRRVHPLGTFGGCRYALLFGAGYDEKKAAQKIAKHTRRLVARHA